MATERFKKSGLDNGIDFSWSGAGTILTSDFIEREYDRIMAANSLNKAAEILKQRSLLLEYGNYPILQKCQSYFKYAIQEFRGY